MKSPAPLATLAPLAFALLGCASPSPPPSPVAEAPVAQRQAEHPKAKVETGRTRTEGFEDLIVGDGPFTAAQLHTLLLAYAHAGGQQSSYLLDPKRVVWSGERERCSFAKKLELGELHGITAELLKGDQLVSVLKIQVVYGEDGPRISYARSAAPDILFAAGRDLPECDSMNLYFEHSGPRHPSWRQGKPLPIPADFLELKLGLVGRAGGVEARGSLFQQVVQP
ncbi:MAG: hypothetical protein AB7N76_35665 [Planctomycetota bacterium]